MTLPARIAIVRGDKRRAGILAAGSVRFIARPVPFL
jgi:hypothetical protein